MDGLWVRNHLKYLLWIETTRQATATKERSTPLIRWQRVTRGRIQRVFSAVRLRLSSANYLILTLIVLVLIHVRVSGLQTHRNRVVGAGR